MRSLVRRLGLSPLVGKGSFSVGIKTRRFPRVSQRTVRDAMMTQQVESEPQEATRARNIFRDQRQVLEPSAAIPAETAAVLIPTLNFPCLQAADNPKRRTSERMRTNPFPTTYAAIDHESVDAVGGHAATPRVNSASSTSGSSPRSLAESRRNSRDSSANYNYVRVCALGAMRILPSGASPKRSTA